MRDEPIRAVVSLSGFSLARWGMDAPAALRALYHRVVNPAPVPSDPRGDATRILRAAAGGDTGDAERLLSLLYDELHSLADGYMAGERGDHTLQPTALVHEAWMKLFHTDELVFQDRRHFLATAARAMRQILVDHARSKQRIKRGGGWKRVDSDVELTPDGREGSDMDLVALDRALDKLRENSVRQAEVVELRYFGGLSVQETAEVLETSERTVVREWRFAKAWLTRELGLE